MISKVIENTSLKNNFYRLTLQSPILAKTAHPGQFIMIRPYEGLDPFLRRPFSIHRLFSHPGSIEPDGIQILYQVKGKGSAYMTTLRPGTEIDLLGPLGHGFQLPQDLSFPLLIAGGMGIAPLVYLADYLLQNRPSVQPHLFLGAKSCSDLLCTNDFPKDHFVLHLTTEDGSAGEKGLITAAVSTFLGGSSPPPFSPETVLFACGPPGLLSRVIQLAKKYHLWCQVSYEQNMACGVGACLGCVIEWGGEGTIKSYQRVCTEGPVFQIKG